MGAPSVSVTSADSASDVSDQMLSEPSTTAQVSSWAGINEDGSFSDGWLDKLPEDLRGDPSLKVFRSLPALATSYVETKGHAGKKLGPPGEDATPEQLTAWRKVVGAPEKLEGYYGDAKPLRPEMIPEGLWSTVSEKQFLEIAHKHHLPPAAVREILSLQAELVSAAVKTAQEAETSILQIEGMKLREAWGRDFDSNLALAGRVARVVGLDPNTHPIFTSAEMVQVFAEMGKLLSEDKLVRGDAQGINGSTSEKIRDITDPNSQSILAREYRGEFGAQRQSEAQQQYHQLLQTTQQR